MGFTVLFPLILNKQKGFLDLIFGGSGSFGLHLSLLSLTPNSSDGQLPPILQSRLVGHRSRCSQPSSGGDSAESDITCEFQSPHPLTSIANLFYYEFVFFFGNAFLVDHDWCIIQ